MDAVLTALVEDKIGPGEQTRLLIQIAREKIGFDYCIAFRSPVIALSIILKSLFPEQGQGLIISPLAPRYCLNVLDDLKIKPLYADVQPGSPYMSRESILKALESKPDDLTVRAVLLHHSLGYVPNSLSLSDLDLPLIEDCSQSFPTVVTEKTSTYSIMGLEEKDIITAGGGALLYTFNRKDSSTLKEFDNLPPEYGLPDMNAAMGVIQLREAKKSLERRGEIARVYTQAALRTRHKRFPDEDYNNYAFPLILETGLKDVKTYARRKDIIVESAFENSIIASGIIPFGLCPEAYSLSLRTVLFPLYPRLRQEEIEKVSKLIASLP